MPQSNAERFREEAAKKVKKKAKSKIKRKVKSKAKKTAKSIHALSYVIWVLAIIAGIGAGVLYGMFACRNDCFELRGKDLTYDVGEKLELVDPGVKVIQFGRDISDKVTVESNMTKNENGTYTVDTSVPGVYYIKYTVDSWRYGEICRIRTVTIGGEQ